MDKITLPEPLVSLARCPHCQAEVKMTEVWYTRLQAIVQALNSLIP